MPKFEFCLPTVGKVVPAGPECSSPAGPDINGVNRAAQCDGDAVSTRSCSNHSFQSFDFFSSPLSIAHLLGLQENGPSLLGAGAAFRPAGLVHLGLMERTMIQRIVRVIVPHGMAY